LEGFIAPPLDILAPASLLELLVLLLWPFLCGIFVSWLVEFGLLHLHLLQVNLIGLL
jgi:hypothetical protein